MKRLKILACRSILQWQKNDYLSHHGVLGQKWGIRRYQNKDGTLTDSGKKHYYKESLRADKKLRKELESKVYASSKLADAYYKKGNYYAKKYAKAVAKDPTESNPKTQRLRNTFTTLAADAEYWDHYNHEQMGKLGDQVQSMIDKYPDTKIKDINVNTTKYGTRYIKKCFGSHT